MTTRRTALTAIEVIVVIICCLVLLLVVEIWPRSGSRELSPRAICAANMKGIGTGCYTYGNENKEFWPIAPSIPASQPEAGSVVYAPNKIGTHRSAATTERDTEMSTTRNLWRLVREGTVAPKTFYCPKSKDEPNNEDLPGDFWDFRKYAEVSYGYQVPYGLKGLPSNDCDQRMPLAADKGPFGAALEAGRKNPGVPTPGLNDVPDDWRPWNSPNHGGEGQCVLFADGHVSYETTPLAGINHDNIYTRWPRADAGSKDAPAPQIAGTPPTSNETPWSDTDSLIYP
jgi:hypothetical protein